MHVLIIQSSVSNDSGLEDIIRMSGFEVHVVKSLSDLNASMLPEDTRIICLDVSNDIEQDNELCMEIRNINHLQMLPVIVIYEDAVTDSDSKKGYLKCGATEIIARDDIETIKHSFMEYAHRFNHDKFAGHVLLVEDEELLSELIATHLESRGLQVDQCTTAEDALLQFHENQYDLVITDIVLGGSMTGLALLRSIRASTKSDTRIPVLVISAFDNPARKMELLYSGADDYLPKPLEPLELLTRAGNMLRAKFMCDAIREQKEELRLLSTTDVLTGLYNKRYLYEQGATMLSNASRHSENLSMMVIDVDKFKPINDEYGHDVGDMVLSHIGRIIQSSIRAGDVATRFGGDEFVVLLSHSNINDAREKGQDLCKIIYELKPCDIVVTASIGITEYRKDEKPDFFTLFKQGDKAVYQAKNMGGNQVSVYP